MYICNYCNRNFKEKYEVCPGCGGNKFTEKAYLGETIIETPPDGGYKLNLANIYATKSNNNIGSYIFIGLGGIILLAAGVPFILATISLGADIKTDSFSLSMFIPFLIGAIIVLFMGFGFLGLGIYNMLYVKKETKNKIKKANYLAQHGWLVKNLPYTLEYNQKLLSNNTVCIHLTYENSNGSKIPLVSEPKASNGNIPYKTADLLIDPDDYSNFFIDFEIY